MPPSSGCASSSGIPHAGELEREWLPSAERIAAEAARCVAY
jgi:hypothetical protein